ncbi:uncharacterized protein LOC111493353 [Cucurbita maxima]|uniref:Uncharacterized protein LOC111493353 n=1 Tax=Cucurbita maxima TaxID=3661 RepID=A0A6J1K8Y2_CUCMA|nr:uncharacterized protein LOC111493353 [Cucurbita maxima]
MTDNNHVAIQLDRVPSTDKGARRVAFSDSLPKHRSASLRATKFVFSHLFAFCAWICLAVFGIAITLLILGVIFVSFLQSSLPEITVKMLDLSKIQIQNSTNQNVAVLNTKVRMAIDIRNKNEKLELSYSDLNMKLVSENIELGRNVIPSFSQEPGNTTSLNVTLKVDRDSIDRDSISLLEDDRKKAQVVVKITMVGSVGFHLGIFKLNKVPIHVTCNFQQYLLLYRVKEPPCSITMFPTR